MEKTTNILGGLVDKLYGWAESFVAMLPNLALAVLVVVGFGLASRWVEKAVSRLLLRASDNQPISELAGSVARVGTIILGLFAALSLLQLDKTVTSLIAGVGVIGLGLGFAFQDIAANFMSGFLMAVKRPFDVGDTVEVGDRVARVQAIELRATHLQTLDGLSIIMPNKEIFQNPIINYTRTPQRRMEVAVGVAYSDDLELAQRVTGEALQDLKDRDRDREVEVFFTEFGGSSINLVARVWLDGSEQRQLKAATSDAIIAIKKAYDQNGLNIPFPIRTLDFGARDVGGVRLDEMKNEAANDLQTDAAE